MNAATMPKPSKTTCQATVDAARERANVKNMLDR